MKILLTLSLVLMATGLFATTASKEKTEVVERENVPSIRNVFEKLQTPALELLSRTKRLDMMDYYDADSILRVRNEMNGISYLDTVANGYLRVRPTAVSVFEIKILPYKKESVIMTLYTVGSGHQSPDTEISFYDNQLRRLEQHKFFRLPEFKELFKPSYLDKESLEQMAELIPFPTMEFHAGADSDSLSGRVTVGEFLSEEARKKSEEALVDGLQYAWKGNRYELIKADKNR